jgi:hypothetical protein
MNANVEGWLKAVQDRHVQPMGRPEFLKAVRALSARYVERRSLLSERSAIDSAGKRAAFAGFFAPLHFLATSFIVQEMKLNDAPLGTIVDLGCGTGAAGAAWAVLLPKPPVLTGVDIHPWAVSEANWSWRTLGLEGRARRGDVVRTCLQLRERSRRSSLAGTGIVLAWTVNELSDDARRRLLPALLDLAREGASVVVIEPIARRVAPWWSEWEATFGQARGIAREWNADIGLANGATQSWAELDREAGFDREALSARCLCIRAHSDRSTTTGSTRAARRAGKG